MARPFSKTSKPHSKTIKTWHKSGYTVNLCKHYKPDQPQTFSVLVYRTLRTDRTRKTFAFAEEQKAMDFFNLSTENPEKLLQPSDTDLEYYHPQARDIVVAGVAPAIPTLHLFFLLAIDQVRLQQSPARKAHAQHVADLLKDCAVLPSPHDDTAWRLWVKNCATILVNNSLIEGKKGLGADTVAHRIALFKRCFKYLVAYSDLLPNGKAFLSQAAKVPHLLDDVVKISKNQIRKRESYKPLTRAEIVSLVEVAPSVALKIHLLKMLSFGFRPGEAANASYDKILQNKVDVTKIVTKTKDYLKSGNNPNASLSIRIILRVETEFEIKMVASDRVWLKKHCPVTLKALRTTCACHLLYSGGNLDVVKQRLSHTSLDMAINHYNMHSITDVGNKSPKEYYELPSTLSVKNSDVFMFETNEWDRFILFIALVTFKGLFPDKKTDIAEWVTQESGTRDVKQVASYEF